MCCKCLLRRYSLTFVWSSEKKKKKFANERNTPNAYKCKEKEEKQLNQHTNKLIKSAPGTWNSHKILINKCLLCLNLDENKTVPP